MINISFTIEEVIIVFLIEVLFSLMGGQLKGVMDSIAHHDSLWDKVPAFMRKFFSRKQYWEGKYDFIKLHPWWSTNSQVKMLGRKWTIVPSGAKKWVVENIIVMFIDAWHLSAFLDVVVDTLAFVLPFWMVTGWFWTPFIILYLVYQLGFRKTYK